MYNYVYDQLICYLVKGCGEQLNATITSQQYVITSPNNVQSCNYVILAELGSGLEANITDGTSSGIGCGEVKVLFDQSMYFFG